MSTTINKVLQLCERQYFVQPVFFTKNTTQFVEYFKFGFVGELLKNNIYHEWRLNMVVNTNENVFPFYSVGTRTGNVVKDLTELFDHAKRLSNVQLPFGIAETRCDTRKMEEIQIQGETKYFQPEKHTMLWSCIFARPANAMQRFFQWQRQRKMWWRKFSSSPGRFALTDIQTVSDAQQVEIKAEFSWGSETVETIRYSAATPFEAADTEEKVLFEVKDGRKKVLPHLIESSVSLDGSVMTFLCDAYEEALFLGLPREVMNFHRKLAPYKASFSASSSTASVGEELSELALYLTRQLRTAGISTLLLPDVAKKSLESQFARNDEMGIPYTVVLNDASLRNGIVGLRSRDTTLKEQIHVSDLKLYMEKLLKNY